jgi:diguanylate cyclase (GGDEF)-like protein
MAGWEADMALMPGQDQLVGAYLRDAITESARTRRPINRELPTFQPDGTRRWLQAIGEVHFHEAQPVKAIGIVKDISDEKETQSRLFSMANHDALTGLPNRRHFLEKFEATLLTRGASGALLLIDLDNFKDVNDTGGHDVGDALLKAFARRLEEVVKNGVVARLGGDEFGVLLPDIQQPMAERQALALLASLREPVTIFGRQEIVRLSAGLTTFPADGRDATALLKNADLATYAAKARGRNSLVTYKSEIREASEWRVTVCSDVEDALASNQFVPYYQPKISLKTGQITGFEALLRWEHPKGLRSPGAILPAFDVPELSRAICSRMLDRIVIDMKQWQGQNLAFGRVAFNASAAEFDGFDLVNRVLRKLRGIGLPPECIGLEVTETVFLGKNSDAIVNSLKQLHDAGVEIALDDFGTGYASLTHLQKFPVDVIKIDQSFIRGLSTDSGSQAITSVVLGLGRSLDMKVVAEGVETSEQAKLLSLGGCDEVQGYYFARPMPASEVPAFITNWRGNEEIGGTRQMAA